MKGFWLRIRLAACASLLTAGCISSQNTRMPTLGWGDPRAERASYTYHDPYPERETGPFVERPRGADHQRAEPRRTMERAVNPSGYGSMAPSAQRYQNTVTP